MRHIARTTINAAFADIDAYHTHNTVEEWDAGSFGMDGFDTTVARMEDTGLSMAVGIICDCRGTRVPRTPYLLASQHHGNQFRPKHTFHITLEQSPRVIGNPGFADLKDSHALKFFVTSNLQSLLDHWEHKNGSFDVLESLKCV